MTVDTNPQVFLSAEERAALAESDDDAPAIEAADDVDAELPEQDGGESYAPLLTVKEIPQAGAALSALDEREAILQTKFDEGEITSGEMAAGLREIEKHRGEITWAQRKNELARDMAQTHDDEQWNKAVRSFMSKEGATIAKNETMALAFDAHVRKVTGDSANAGLSFRKQLSKAKKLFDADVARAGFSVDGGSGGSNTASGGSTNFAALDRLADSDPAKFERAFAKLSSAEQQEYLET